MGTLFDLYEMKGLTSEQLRAEYRGLTGLDNDEEMTDEQVYNYMLDALKEDDDDIVVYADSVKEAVEKIKEEYRKNDLCIGELMESIRIEGLTIGGIVDVYAILYRYYENDEVYRVDEDGTKYYIGV